MKKSIITQVFHGLKGTVEMIKVTEEGRKLESIANNAYNELKKELTPQQIELQEKFIIAKENVFCEESDNHYIEGFKLGLLIGMECMEE